MSDRGTIGVALLGLGTVGSGVARILQDAGDMLSTRAGGPLRLRKILVQHIDKSRPIDVPAELLTTDADEVLNTPDVDVVVEVIGGIEPARTLVVAALTSGKRVVTANKALVASCGPELSQAAAEGGGSLHYEAAAAGAIPIVKALRESLTGNRIEAILGIVNGTCNYILTQMSEAGSSFEHALGKAQELGYAEADPSSDVGGQDSAFKIALLAELAFGGHVPADAVHCEGITSIRAEDISQAAELGMVIKLLAVAARQGDAIELRVHPAMLAKDHPLAAVRDAYNAVFVRGDAAGELMFYGSGAGQMPTASAVVADVVDACQDLRRGVSGRLLADPRQLVTARIDDAICRYYVATRVVDQPGVLAAIAGLFSRHRVSIETCIQKGRDADPVDLIFITHSVREGDIRAALAEVKVLPIVREVASVIRLVS